MFDDYPPEKEPEEEQDPCEGCTTDCSSCTYQTELDKMLGIYSLRESSDNFVHPGDKNYPYGTIPLPGLQPPESIPDNEPLQPLPVPTLASSPADPQTVLLDFNPSSTPAWSRGHPREEMDSSAAPGAAKRRPGRINDSTAAPGAAKRRPGGQPGNLNAIKHGLYVVGNAIHNTTPMDRAKLCDINVAISHLKDYINTAFENGQKVKTTFEINETLRVLSCAGIALTRMIGTHNEYSVCSLPSALHHRDKTTSLNEIQKYYEKKVYFLEDDSGSASLDSLNASSDFESDSAHFSQLEE